MAHTLKAYYYTDPATAVTVDFYGAVADNDGIAVTSYQMGVPGIEQARNSSLYSDSPRPVYSKHGTVTDVLTVDVRGSSNTNLYTNLHLLAKLGEFARFTSQNAGFTRPAYLEIKPGGSAAGEVLYAQIYDCRVEMPSDWADTVDARLTIEDVTVTIERGLWRSVYPNAFSGFTTQFNQTGLALSSSYAADVGTVGGDTLAHWWLTISQGSGAVTINRAIIGYRSKLHGGGQYNLLGKKEAESQTNGTDTSDAVDATASGGNKVECTFGTATIATRLSGTSIPHGVHRVFARMKITSTAVATVNIKYQDTNLTNVVYVANSSVSVSSTSWLVYDMGIVRFGQTDMPTIYNSTMTGVWAIDALKASGSGNLDIDWVYFMPTEGYVTASGFSMVYDASNTEYLLIGNAISQGTAFQFQKGEAYLRLASAQYTASMPISPGLSCLYWLMGTDSGSNFDVGITTPLSILYQTVDRFIMPSEV